jgi:hypothetical protein
MLKDRADCDIDPSGRPLMLPSYPAIMQSAWQVNILILLESSEGMPSAIRRIDIIQLIIGI